MLTIDFGKLEKELKSKEVVIKYHNIGIYLKDKNGIVYQIEKYFYGSYLDKLIAKEQNVNFYRVSTEFLDLVEAETKSSCPAVTEQERI